MTWNRVIVVFFIGSRPADSDAVWLERGRRSMTVVAIPPSRTPLASSPRLPFALRLIIISYSIKLGVDA